MTGRHRKVHLRRARILLTTGRTAGQTASWAALVAALPLALGRPDPGLWLSAITAAWAAPVAIAELPLVAGRLADSPRWGPRRAGAASWALAAVAAAAAVISRDLPVVIAALAVTSAARGVGVVAGDTAPSWLPGQPDLGISAAWVMLGDTLPVLAGPLGSATLLYTWGARAPWIVTAALFAVAGCAAVAVPAIRPPAVTATVPAFSGRRRWLPVTRIGGMLAVTAGIWLSYGAMEILQPLFVKDELHSSLIVYGWIMASNATAGSVMSVAAMPKRSALRTFLRWRWSVPVSALAVAASLRVFTATNSVTVAMGGSALWGAAAVLFTLSSKEVILSQVPAQAHGEAMALWRTVQSGAYTAPAAATGPLTARFGLAWVLAGVCALAGASALCHGVGTAVTGVTRPRARRRAALTLQALALPVPALPAPVLPAPTLAAPALPAPTVPAAALPAPAPARLALPAPARPAPARPAPALPAPRGWPAEEESRFVIRVPD
ncbi:MAG TPA: MFS transporter [Streptosporangiaceae bacterium]|nr:MFS transporter [Streptosporangiaceae bacterium]